MLRHARPFALLTTLASSGCGVIGLELLELPDAFRDGGQGDAGELEGGTSPFDGGSSPSDGATAPFDGATPPSDASFADARSLDDARVPASDAAAPGDASRADAGPSCSVSGTWALKIATSVTWPGPLLAAGSGTSVIWARFVGTESGNNLSGSFEPCGFTLPDFKLNPAAGTETYQIDFPDTLFDHAPPYIPTTALSISSASGFVLGQAYSVPQIGVQVGAMLSNPATDAWPAATALVTTDLDGDGKPGVTATYNAGTGYTLPRLDLAGSTRADRAYTAARFTLSGSGNLTSCTQLDGSIDFTRFDTHIVGCHATSGADCNSTQVSTIDAARPMFAPSAATLRAVKVAAGATCADVRSAVP